ncbi:PREDICTED: ral GTPase-activating protein subunit beta [Papilio polytes]|uniref:ral GTPase-activating protein subunit beta n=1 Tax=Papilio polytes TaxID=76194 RepID=UPI0006760835|nr:PREDICTED: ral GTPase-activating protein subunit beta [Papilio polytes]
MNVGIFNRVNFKSKDSEGMYSEWSSLPLEGGGQGVLGAVGGRDVVLAVVKQLASHQPSPLTTDTEVEWVLEVLRYGLSLPLTEHEALRACVYVCHAWLGALLPPAPASQPPQPAIPPPLAADPKRYASKILSHLHNLFIPRADDSADLISKQAVLCHRVLRLARSLADSGALGPREWRSLLLLLLAAAAALLAPPAPHHGAEQLCERVLCVLFEVWILACHRCFPSPALWRTLREQCVRWRHRAPLAEQWARASLCLTARLLAHMYGPMFPAMPIGEEDANLVPAEMSAEAVMQTWYRVLHTIGNPVDLCRPHLISQTPEFLQEVIIISTGRGADWRESCGAGAGAGSGAAQGGAGAGEGEDELTPPAHRRLAKSFSVASRPRDKLAERSTPRSSLIGLTGSRPPSVAPTTPPNSISSQVGETEKPPLTPLRPKVNSILHLFGEWLFEAALIGTTSNTNQPRTEGTPPPPSLSDASHRLNMMSYQPGRAVALGTLCRVICSKQCREEVVAPYLARAYAALQRGLQDPATAAAIVLDAADIFRLDLDGVLVLVPDFITALDLILSEREPKIDCGSIDKRELRKAAISLLLSLVAFPYHYRGLPVPEFPGCNEYAGMTIGDYARGKLSLICVSAVQVETSEALAVPLLSALYLCVRHNAYVTTGKAHSAPPGSTMSHTTEYKAHSDGGRGEHAQDDYAADVRDLDPSSPVFGAALVVRATYLVCHRLISSWKGDLQVSLAALELLSGLAKLHSVRPEAIERKRAVRWICDYIAVQCGRPPQAHSRDLHSCVVAAYHCLAAWLCPALLADVDCLTALMEVVELGISGSKSHGQLYNSNSALTVHVLYARAAQRHAHDIVANAHRTDLAPAYINMLRGLGRAVNVRGHAGWAGHVRNSYDAHAPRPAPRHAHKHTANPPPAIYDGTQQILYWSDSTDEIAFIVPSGNEILETEEKVAQSDSLKSYVDGPCASTCSKGACVSGCEGAPAYVRSVSESERGPGPPGGQAERGERRAALADSARALSLELDKQPSAGVTGSGRRNRDFTAKILIVWLEDFEDHLNLPVDDLLRYCETGVPWRRQEASVVCVSAVRGGLVRVRVPGGAGAGAAGAAGVLAEGALVAPRALPDCLRRAATHLARRTRLQAELYQPPHVRRRHMIQEIAQQYRRDLSEPELLESLFRPPN